MSIDEFLLLIISGIFTYKFLLEWYRYTRSEWPPERVKIQRVVFCLLPVISFAMIFFTLKELASFDVVNDGIYLFLYILFGFAWIYICFSFIFRLFDVSWKDDVLNNNNKAALFAMTGAFLGITAVFCGANTGDGPGWWC
ncbi:MAG: hypothetical protein LBI03_05970, partial [Clostridiales bacterium]|nr:hypothetical protein [Clostridiales bacterium]